MSQEKNSKKVSYRNSVKLVGFLKESTLSERVSNNGKHFITGNITVAVNEFNTHRVRFTVFQEDNADKYDALTKFLPSNTVTIASYLKSTPTANFATAASMAAKVWVMAGFEEYAVRKGENEKSSVVLRGYTIGTPDPEKTFLPSATFELDTYIKSMEPEVDDETPTGRLLVEAVVPAYKDLVYIIPLVAPVEDNVAKFMGAKYEIGDTARLSGNLVAMRVQLNNEEDDGEEKEPEYFGKQSDQQYTTRFIREYVITRGPTKPIKQGEEGSISNESVTKGLAIRETTMEENGKRKPKETEESSSSESVQAAEPAPAPVAESKAPAANSEDFDF